MSKIGRDRRVSQEERSAFVSAESAIDSAFDDKEGGARGQDDEGKTRCVVKGQHSFGSQRELWTSLILALEHLTRVTQHTQDDEDVFGAFGSKPCFH